MTTQLFHLQDEQRQSTPSMKSKPDKKEDKTEKVIYIFLSIWIALTVDNIESEKQHDRDMAVCRCLYDLCE